MNTVPVARHRLKVVITLFMPNATSTSTSPLPMMTGPEIFMALHTLLSGTLPRRLHSKSLMIFHMKTLSLLLSFLLLSLEFQSVTFCVMLMCSEIAISIIIGIYFTNLQEYEYIETSFTVADSVYKSTFFVATGFHGLHMIIGLPFLITCVL